MNAWSPPADPLHPDEPARVPLHPGGDPAEGPSLTFRAAGSAPRGAVLLIPGGGYSFLSTDREGRQIAAPLHDAGFDVGLLRYRLGPAHRHPAMANDACAGLRLFRRTLREAGRPDRVGVMGFSAGGHLAATLALHGDRFEDRADPDARDAETRVDALVLGYSVIDLERPLGHVGSRLSLLGADPNPATLDLLSLHRHVKPDAPPTFLFHAADDGPVPVGNTLAYASACAAAGVAFSVHVYEEGSHGFGIASAHREAHAWFPAACGFLERHLCGR